ncbi:MAG: hypothetical protein V3W19_05335 [Desulfatiglandales bacterium]
MHGTLATMIERLGDPGISEASVIPWGCPVPSFGDLLCSTVATVGLNPSNREFVDQTGRELSGQDRRFHTLNSLGLSQWADVDKKHLQLILESCQRYFQNNPYGGWFNKLENLLSGVKASYYIGNIRACHLDLVPYATVCKWTELTPGQRSSLFAVSGNSLGLLLSDSPVKLLVLNGQSVVEQFQKMAGIALKKRAMRSWSLPRNSQPGITGFAYKGVALTIAGVPLKREVLVLGFNHNLQSSFGVTNQVKAAIRQWIARTSEEVL